MTDRVLLSAGTHNLGACISLAVEHRLGIELMTFADPDVLDGDWQGAVESCRSQLAGVPGAITLHAPYIDMAPGSADRRVNAVCLERYEHAVRIAQALGARLVVFHANFIASLKTDSYRQEWQKRNVAFWRHMAGYGAQRDVVVAVENMWEFDPDIIGDVLKAVDDPNLRGCLDVGHAYLYSDVPLSEWLAALGPFIAHLHLNNNDNLTDAHRALPDGALDYASILPLLRALPTQPGMVLEMETVEDMRRSLPLLDVRTSVR